MIAVSAPANFSLAPPRAENASAKWLVNAPVDLIFGCGGLVAFLLAVHLIIAPSAWGQGPNVTDPFPLLGLLGTIFIGDAHNAASLVQLYRTKQSRHRFWLVSYLAPVGFLLFAATLLFHPALLGLFSKVYLLLIVHHVAAQAYGLAVMYCHKQDYALSASQARSMKFVFNSLALYAIVCQFVYPTNFRTQFFGVDMVQITAAPQWLLSLPLLFVALSAVTFFRVVIVKFFNEGKLLPLPVCMLIAAMILVAACVQHSSGLLSLYIPAFFHGSQYLLVSIATYLEGERSNSNKPAPLAGYAGRLLLLTLSIFAILPQVLTVTGHTFQTTFLTVFLTINFHHFLTDAFIWRRRAKAA